MERKDILERKEDILHWMEEERPKVWIAKQLNCSQTTLNIYFEFFVFMLHNILLSDRDDHFGRAITSTGRVRVAILVSGPVTAVREWFIDGNRFAIHSFMLWSWVDTGHPDLFHCLLDAVCFRLLRGLSCRRPSGSSQGKHPPEGDGVLVLTDFKDMGRRVFLILIVVNGFL